MPAPATAPRLPRPSLLLPLLLGLTGECRPRGALCEDAHASAAAEVPLPHWQRGGWISVPGSLSPLRLPLEDMSLNVFFYNKSPQNAYYSEGSLPRPLRSRQDLPHQAFLSAGGGGSQSHLISHTSVTCEASMIRVA